MARSSSIIHNALSKWSAEHGMANRTLILDYRVRWNTTYTMLLRVWNFKLYVNFLTSGVTIEGLSDSQVSKLDKLKLKKEDWDLMVTLIKILEPFYQATKLISGRNNHTLSLGKAFENIMFDTYDDLMAKSEAGSAAYALARAVTHEMTNTWEPTPMLENYSRAG